MAGTKRTGDAKTSPEEEKKELLQEVSNQMAEEAEQAGEELEPMPEEPEQTGEENLGCRVYVKAPNNNYAGTIGGISFGNGHAVFELDSEKNKHMKEWFQNNGYSVEYV